MLHQPGGCTWRRRCRPAAGPGCLQCKSALSAEQCRQDKSARVCRRCCSRASGSRAPRMQTCGPGRRVGQDRRLTAAACCSGNRPALWQRAAAAWVKRCAGNEALQEWLLHSRAAGSGRISPWDHRRSAGPLRPRASSSSSTTTIHLPWGQSQPPWPHMAGRLPTGGPAQVLPPPPPLLRHPARPRQHWSGAAQPVSGTHRARAPREKARPRARGPSETVLLCNPKELGAKN